MNLLLNILPAWLLELLTPNENPSIASSLVLIFVVMATGIMLGKIKVAGVSLGSAGVMFTGIFAGHLGFRLEEGTLNFLKDAGLILVVYAIGMQVGPSFFSSLKKDGLIYNALAAGTVLLGAAGTIILFKITSTGMDNLVGIMSGAVTNTPGLGAAQATLLDLKNDFPEKTFNDPANAYAITYPFGVIGVILVMLLGKRLFNISVEKEMEQFEEGIRRNYPAPGHVKCRLIRPDFFGKTIQDLIEETNHTVIVSRLKHSGSTIVESPHNDTVLKERDVLMLVGLPADIENAVQLIGRVSNDRFIESQANTMTKGFLVTNDEAVRKSIGQLNLEDRYGARITRVYRAGLELLASPSLVLHFGDKIRVVGDQTALDNIAKLVGNSEKRLNEPQLLSIFLGIVFGVLLGSIPFVLPGLSAPVKLGMAAGPLLVALVISRYGGIRTMHSYLNQSAMLFMKDFGMCLFFAAVGIHAGDSFYQTFITYNGWLWVVYGMCITMLPLLITIIIARVFLKMNYMPMMGLASGSYTDPAALAFSTNYFKSDLPMQAYATVYPLVTILRILVAQVLVLYFTT